jgi:hypothetical protein
MKEITLQEASLAWAQGKRVEACRKNCVDWKPMVPVVGGDGYYSPHAFVEKNATHPFLFRLAAEPTAKKFRPWTPEEVPVGALTRSQVLNEILMIIGRNEDGVRLADDDGWYSYSSLVLARTYSTDGGETWLPCGVEVEA